jgi:ACT domain-containing protein
MTERRRLVEITWSDDADSDEASVQELVAHLHTLDSVRLVKVVGWDRRYRVGK